MPTSTRKLQQVDTSVSKAVRSRAAELLETEFEFVFSREFDSAERADAILAEMPEADDPPPPVVPGDIDVPDEVNSRSRAMSASWLGCLTPNRPQTSRGRLLTTHPTSRWLPRPHLWHKRLGGYRVLPNGIRI